MIRDFLRRSGLSKLLKLCHLTRYELSYFYWTLCITIRDIYEAELIHRM